MKVVLNKINYNLFFMIFFLTVSPISKLLVYAGIPRAATYIVFLLALFVSILYNARIFVSKMDVVLTYLILIPTTLYAFFARGNLVVSDNALYAMVLVFLPAYFVMRTIKRNELTKALYISAYLSFAVYVPQAFFLENIRAAYMNYAYDILFSVCIICYRAIDRHKAIDIIAGSFGCICLIVFGCRGALLTFCVFLLYVFARKLNKRRVLVLTGALVAVAIVVTNFTAILNYLSNKGIDSRTLKTIMEGSFFASDSRMILYEYLWEELKGNYLGLGPLGSRDIMPSSLYPYPHSVFFELLLDYGYFVGGAVFLLLCIYCFRLLSKAREDEEILIAGIICIVNIVPLFLSSTFYEIFSLPFVFAYYKNNYKRMKNVMEPQINVVYGRSIRFKE